MTSANGPLLRREELVHSDTCAGVPSAGQVVGMIDNLACI
jgi:hypothetical protein